MDIDIDIDFALATNAGKDALRPRRPHTATGAFPAGWSGAQPMP
jgi:hypothetical protein